MDNTQQYLTSNTYFDFEHPAVQELCDTALVECGNSKKEQVVALYNFVRDHFPYNPYRFDMSFDQFKASHCAVQEQSYCIPKAVLFGAMCRSIGVPARIGLVDVKNHISSPRLIELLKTDVFAMHGYTEIYMDQKWVKATPAFDANLCRFMGIDPMPFNGEEDSVFQAYNLDGDKHMEYLTNHGTFADVPVTMIFDAVKTMYPHLDFTQGAPLLDHAGSLEQDMTEIE